LPPAAVACGCPVSGWCRQEMVNGIRAVRRAIHLGNVPWEFLLAPLLLLLLLLGLLSLVLLWLLLWLLTSAMVLNVRPCDGGSRGGMGEL